MSNNDSNNAIVTLKKDLITEQNFKDLPLSELGLNADDMHDVLKATEQLSDFSNNSIAEFGKGISKNTSKYADDLLSFVHSKDMDATGKQLQEVVSTAQTINVSNLLERPKSHSLPIIGGLLAKFTKTKQSISNNFNSVKDHIDTLVVEIENNQKGLNTRVNMLEKMFDAVGQEHRELGIHIASGKLVLQSIDNEIELTRNNANDALSVQRLSDLNHARSNLDKRVSDLQILQQSAMQTMPMIRIIQANNMMLIDKFYSIKNITLPAWKNNISLAISLQEQKNSVQLANTIDDATNELLKRNADLLHQNSVDTARANQRSVIDIETLEHVQNSLIQTVNDVIQIHKEGQIKRKEASIKIKELQGNLSQLVIENSGNK